MNTYIVKIAIGPVQGMIASARRSIDLWSGSYLLSELAKSCAYFFYNHACKTDLIFPCVQSVENLKPYSDFSVGNIVQLLIEAESVTALEEIIQQAKQQVQQRFLDIAQQAKDNMSNSEKAIREEIWRNQVGDYIEFQAAWAVVATEADYKNAVNKVSGALAARKATREFYQNINNPYDNQYMLPKSSLDGLRETVLHENTQLKNSVRMQLGLSASEQLDTMGIIKRLAFKNQSDKFTPFTRMCIDAWIQQLAEKQTDILEKLNQDYDKLVGKGLATRVRGNHGIYQKFPYDGQLLFPSRLDMEINNDDNDTDTKMLLKQMKDILKPVWKNFGQPNNYGVLLMADGDHMGELLDQVINVSEHKEITLSLSRFAQSVPDIMRKYQGHCIYAGGDDVLGFVPLNQAYSCAEELRQVFYNQLLPVAKGAAKKPTLSVGLAIAHFMTPMAMIRDLARQAEQYAKGDHLSDHNQRRNALGICLNVRSGNLTKLRLSWADKVAHERFKQWIDDYQTKIISSRIAYDTREIYLRTKGISTDGQQLYNIQKAEFKRMLKQARNDQGDKLLPETQNQLICAADKNTDMALQSLADELIVTRWIAAKTQKDLGQE